MHILGILGGVACGKSTVAREFEKLGAVTLNADRAGHEVLTEPAVIEALVARWGTSILNADGQIDRPSVAKIVFAPENAEELRFLERTTHPRIRVRLEHQLAELRQQHPPAVILDAALMVEAGWDTLCDTLLFVEVPFEFRLARAKTRGWSEEEFARREAAQLPVEAKKARAKLIIPNGGSTAELAAAVNQIWRKIRQSAIAGD